MRICSGEMRAAFGTTDGDPHASTLPDALASLSNLCLLPSYPIDEKTTVTKPPQPSANQKQILTALGVTPPGKVDRRPPTHQRQLQPQ